MLSKIIKILMQKSGKDKKTIEKVILNARSEAEDLGQQDNWEYILETAEIMLGLSENVKLEKYESLFSETISTSLANFTPSENPIAIDFNGNTPFNQKKKPKPEDHYNDYDGPVLPGWSAAEKRAKEIGFKVLDKDNKEDEDVRGKPITNKTINDLDVKEGCVKKKDKNEEEEIDETITSGSISADVPEKPVEVVILGKKKKKEKVKMKKYESLFKEEIEYLEYNKVYILKDAMRFNLRDKYIGRPGNALETKFSSVRLTAGSKLKHIKNPNRDSKEYFIDLKTKQEVYLDIDDYMDTYNNEFLWDDIFVI